MKLSRRDQEMLHRLAQGGQHAPQAKQGHPRQRKPRPLVNEAEIARNGVKELELRGIWTIKVNPGSYTVREGEFHRFIRQAPQGTADRIGLLNDGRFLGVEWKRPGDRPRVDQIAWMQTVNARGGVAFWADSMPALARVLDHIEAGGRVHVEADGGWSLI
jgi:hypothetical protein